MKLSDKLRTLREVEGRLRGLDRAMTQGELLRALAEEQGQALSQSYLSQIESGTRPHLTNNSRQLLAGFFKVHPGYLVDDPAGYHPELLTDLRHAETTDARLDAWLEGGAVRFGEDEALAAALEHIARHPDSRRWLLLLGRVLASPDMAKRFAVAMEPDCALGTADERSAPTYKRHEVGSADPTQPSEFLNEAQ